MIMIETNRHLRHQPHRLGNTEHETWNIRFLERPYEKEKPPVTYDTRYRYKLDMLEPGTIMLKWVGIFLLIGLALELLRWKLAAAIAFGFSGALFLLLLILLAIKAHQDRVLNEIAAQEDRDTD